MRLNGVHIEDTFAEAFPMLGTRLVITADTPDWVQAAVVSAASPFCTRALSPPRFSVSRSRSMQT